MTIIIKNNSINFPKYLKNKYSNFVFEHIKSNNNNNTKEYEY